MLTEEIQSSFKDVGKKLTPFPAEYYISKIQNIIDWVRSPHQIKDCGVW